LVRWRHPEKGILPPGQFIGLAEKTGLIIPLGWWVLEESCRQLKAWQTTIPFARDLFVSVNMSSKQFSQKDVPQRLQRILEAFSLDPKCLKLEITESVLIDHSHTIVETLQAIRAMGIKLSIDDFGTGYSSLSYLHRFPFDTIKIDRSFIENADADFEKLEILQSVVRLAWNLGLEVVAEGIETPKHFAQIKALRCESGQGFLFSKPLNTAAMEQLIVTQAAQFSEPRGRLSGG
jgi:EAL domain-containing protein (putative c-di-GMP-specific phosphodiesterase class I)